MKQELQNWQIKQKESHGKYQTSIYDFIKYQYNTNEAEIDLTKQRLNSLSQKESNIIKQLDRSKQASPNHFEHMSQQHITSQNPIQNPFTSPYSGNYYKQQFEMIPIYKRCYQQVSATLIRIVKLENPCKEEIQPYWRNTSLLFGALMSLTIINSVKLYQKRDSTLDQLSKWIGVFSIVSIFLVASLLMLYYRNKKIKNSSSTFNMPLMQYCFSDSNVFFKIAAQMLVIVIGVFLFILYAKIITESSSSNYINSQLSLQIFEIIVVYQYTSTFFLSFFFLKIVFMLSTFIVNLFILGSESNFNNYYYIILLFIQLLHEYEHTIISIEMQAYFQTNRYISSTFQTELKQPLKQPQLITQNFLLQSNYAETNKKQNLSQYFQSRFPNFGIPKQQKKSQMKDYMSNVNLDDKFYKVSSMEAVGVNTPLTEQNNILLQSKQILSAITKKTSQKVLTQDEINYLISHPSQRNKKESGKIETFLLHEIEDVEQQQLQQLNEVNEVNECRSKKKWSGESGHSRSNKTYKKTTQINRISDFENESQIKNIEISLGNVEQIKVCHSEMSKENIRSSRELSNKSQTSSQNLSNGNIKTSNLSGDISPINRLNRNFSLFRREQVQNSFQIEEKTSQEEAGVYAVSPVKAQRKREMYAYQRSNSLGYSQTNQNKQMKKLWINEQQNYGKQTKGKNKQNKSIYSFTERSQDDIASDSQGISIQNGDFNNESRINVSQNQLQMRFRNRQVSNEYKKDKLNGFTHTPPLGFQKTQTSSHSMPASIHQKQKLYKNILKMLPEEGVVLIDKNRNIHFANLHMQQLFPKSNYLLLFNELIQLKSIETLENYNNYLNDIIDQKRQVQNDQKLRNISQNLTKVQLTDSITCNLNNQESNKDQLQAWQQQYQGAHHQQQQSFSNQKQFSKTCLLNVANNPQPNTGQNINPKTSNNFIQNLCKNNSNQSQGQNNNNANTLNQFPNNTSNYINLSSNQNIPIGHFSPFGQPFSSSASINPTQKMSQSNYFMKLDLFKQAKENFYLKENVIKCTSFLEQFQQIIDNFRQLSASYKQYGIASQNKFTTLLYRPLNNQKQDSIEDVQIFEVQFIPCYLGYTEGVVVTMRDVTHFNQIKVLKDINERKSNMLRNVSHELRQPLNCIISMMQLTRDSYTDQTLIQEYINPTLYSCQILLNLLNDFLDFSQIQAGTFKLTYVSFNIKKLFQNIFQMMKAQIQIRSLNFVLNISNESDIPDEIKSDPHRIQQIITNLLGNAVKFTEQGDIILTLEKVSPYIYKISVTDSGIGITEEGQKNLFKTFGKVDQERKSILNPQGVGLGLMISNILAQQLGPYEDKGLQVESKIGQGTKFSLFILDKTQQDNEFVSFTPFNQNKEKVISPQAIKNNFPYVRRATSKNMETSLFFQGQPIESQEDFCTNSMQIVHTLKNMMPHQQSHLHQTCNFHSQFSFENIQECSHQINNLNHRNPVALTSFNEVHENNIKKIDLKNINQFQRDYTTVYTENVTPLAPQRKSWNFTISPKNLDLNQESIQEKDMIKYYPLMKKKTPSQQSQFITQGIVLRQQTLIIQPDCSPRAQKQLIEDIMYQQKAKQHTCGQCNTKDVLIVDDNDFNIYVLDKYIKSFHIEDDTSTSGPSSEKKVKDKIETSKCDECKVYKLIFMDLNLGSQSGITTAENIIKIYSIYQLPPPAIIACTGLVDEATVQDCLASGFNDFLAKPIIKDQLVEIIHKYLCIQ